MVSISERKCSLSLQSGHWKQEMPALIACPCRRRNVRGTSEALVLPSTCRAPGASNSRGRGNGSYLDAALVEPGVFARWAHHGAVGLSLLHMVQADEAGGVLLRSRLHCLLWAVLPAEGPGGKRKGMGEVRSAGSFPGGSEEGRGGTCTEERTG